MKKTIKRYEPFTSIEIDLLNVLFDNREYHQDPIFGDSYSARIKQLPVEVWWHGNTVHLTVMRHYAAADCIVKTVEQRKELISDKLSITQQNNADNIRLRLWTKRI